MAFPSSNGTKQSDLAFLWSIARTVAGQIKSQAQSIRNASAAGPILANSILEFAEFLFVSKTQLQATASATGIGAYAQAQIGDGAINISTEFTAMMAQIDAVVAWTITNFPKDGSGFLLAQTFNADNSGRTADRPFTTVQLATYRTVLDSLIASID